MLYFETIEPKTLDLLRKIQGHPAFDATRLVGGTALALQIGHRQSIDLVFLGKLTCREYELEQQLREFGETQFVSRSKLIETYLVDGIKVDFVEYNYPWLEDAVVTEELRLATIDDIAAMKLAAITNRGTKKDFVDLFFLLDIYSLSQMFDLYNRKYANPLGLPVLKSLTWFEDANDEPMPLMLKTCDWDNVKQTVIKAVSGFSRV